MTGADGLIAVTPVFAASYSGLFKSFFDVLDKDALAGKPVLLGATGRHRPALAGARARACARCSPTCARWPCRPRSSPPPRTGPRPTASAGARSAGLSGAGSAGLSGAGSPGSDGTGAPVGALADRITRAGRELAEQVALRERPPAADPFALSTSFERLLAGD